MFDIYGPLSSSLIYKHLISEILFSFKISSISSLISVFAAKRTSPVSESNISLESTFPIKNSSDKVISDAFELVSSLICLAVILLPAST